MFALTAASVALATFALQQTFERMSGGHRAHAFRLTRGIVAGFLALTGFFALVMWRDVSHRMYVGTAPDPLALALVGLPVGHFVADLLIVGIAARRGEPARRDLLAHHVLGLIAALSVLRWPPAAPLYLVLFTTEMMPVTTAITSIGAHRGDARLERLGARARVAVLLGWRLPLWTWVGVMIARNLTLRDVPRDELPIYVCSAVFLVVTTTLDVVWTRSALRRARRLR